MRLFSEYKGLRRENYILFFGRVMTSLGSMVWPMFTMILSQKLGLNASTIAFLMMLFSIAGIPLNLLGGKLADHHSKKHIIVICDMISIFGSLFCAFTPLSVFSILVFAFAAMMQQMEFPAYSALVADITPSADRERAYSLNYLGANLGLVLAPTIAGVLFKDYLWLMFLINGLAIASSTLLIWFFLKDTDRISEEENTYEADQAHFNVFEVLKENRLITFFMIAVAIQGAVYSEYGYLMPLDMGAVHGDNGAVLYGTVSSLNCIVVVLFTPLITKLFRRMSDIAKFLAGQLLILAGYAVFRFFLGQIPAYYIAMLVFTWGEIFCTLSCDPYMTRRIPATYRGRIVALNGVFGNIFYAVAQVGVGGMYDLRGSIGAWILVIAAGFVGVAATYILLKMDRKVYPALYENN